MRVPTALTALMLLPCLAGSPLHAQSTDSASVRQIVSTSPILLVFGVLGAEYERRLSPTTSWGVSGAVYRPELFSYASLDGKLRYYPGARALEGFAAGLTAGVTRIGTRNSGNPSGTEDSGTAASLGFTLDYQWLLGTRRRFAVTLGGGAKRFFLFGEDVSGASLVLPTGRISVGRGF
jgi:Protein of unknown function (DUF3575)